METFVTHASVRLKGTENQFEPAICADEACPRAAMTHMHCPFCVHSSIYTDPCIVRAHYRVKHVDKGIEFAGLKIVRCCDRCDIVGSIKGSKDLKRPHWHCYRCRNGFNRRDEALKHYRTHFKTPQTTFQIQIRQEVYQGHSYRREGVNSDGLTAGTPSSQGDITAINVQIPQSGLRVYSDNVLRSLASLGCTACTPVDDRLIQVSVAANETVDTSCVSDSQSTVMTQQISSDTSCVLDEEDGNNVVVEQRPELDLIDIVDEAGAAVYTINWTTSDQQEDGEGEDAGAMEETGGEEVGGGEVLREEEEEEERGNEFKLKLRLAEMRAVKEEMERRMKEEIEQLQQQVQLQSQEIASLRERESDLIVQLEAARHAPCSSCSNSLSSMEKRLKGEYKELLRRHLEELRKVEAGSVSNSGLKVSVRSDSESGEPPSKKCLTVQSISNGAILQQPHPLRVTLIPKDAALGVRKQRCMVTNSVFTPLLHILPSVRNASILGTSTPTAQLPIVNEIGKDASNGSMNRLSSPSLSSPSTFSLALSGNNSSVRYVNILPHPQHAGATLSGTLATGVTLLNPLTWVTGSDTQKQSLFTLSVPSCKPCTTASSTPTFIRLKQKHVISVNSTSQNEPKQNGVDTNLIESICASTDAVIGDNTIEHINPTVENYANYSVTEQFCGSGNERTVLDPNISEQTNLDLRNSAVQVVLSHDLKWTTTSIADILETVCVTASNDNVDNVSGLAEQAKTAIEGEGLVSS